jgi:EF hand
MRKKIIGLFVLASFACVLLIPALGVGQQPGGGKGGGKGGKGPKGGGGQDFGGFGGKQKGPRNGGTQNLDPIAIFNMMSKGTDSIIIANSGMLQMPLQNWAFQNGNTSGVVSREDFASFMATQMQGAGFGGFGGGGGFGGKGGGAGNMDVDQMATQRFMKLDQNGNGYVTADQLTGNAKLIWRQYDTNGDGVLDLEEYKVLFSDMAGGGNGGKSGLGALGAVIAEEWDARPTVFRAGKLPKELPSWFEYCDKNGDGQVGLWEWREHSGKSIAEFQVMDRNGDGLLTAEEVLGYMKAQMGISSGSLADGTMMAKGGKMGANNPWMQGNNGGKKGKGGPGGGKGGPGGGKGGGKGGKGPKGGGGGGFGGNNPWDS